MLNTFKEYVELYALQIDLLYEFHKKCLYYILSPKYKKNHAYYMTHFLRNQCKYPLPNKIDKTNSIKYARNESRIK